MKNKIVLVVSFLIVSFFCTGCMGNVTRGIRHAGFNLSESEFTCNLLLSGKKNEKAYTKLKYVSSTKAITADGKVYEISLGQKFSNEQNCMATDKFTKKVVAIMDDSIIKADDGNFYYLNANGNTDAYSQVTVNDNAYGVYSVLFSDENVVKIVTVDGNSGIYYVLKNDGNIYKIIVTRASSEMPYILASSEIVYSNGRYGKIIDFNYVGANAGTYIWSEDSIYRMKKANSDECGKYADVKCEYVMEEDVELIKYMDYVFGFNGQLLISSYGKVFNVI